MIRRVVDVFLSTIALVLLAGPMFVIAMAVKMGSAGPILFRQRRAGWRGRQFTMFKFRTMRQDVDPYGASPHSPKDQRLTGVGRWLRERSLDELPQLLNVLAGQMTLVGPRPLYQRQAESWTPRQRRRLELRPGLTGYAQVYGRGELTHQQKLELDVHYVENRSFLLDLKIILRTIGGLVSRSGIYETRYGDDREFETDASADHVTTSETEAEATDDRQA